MSQSDMQVYNEQIRLRTIELIAQNIPIFNQASGNAIILSSDGFSGDLSKESFYNTLAGAQRRVDRYGTNNAVSPTNLSESEVVGVKVAGGFGPIQFEPSTLTWLKSTPEEAINAISAGFADSLMADQLNTGVMAVVAAIENQPTLVNDVSALTGGAGALDQPVLNGSHAKFHDMSGLLRTDFMTGAAYHKLIEKGLQNGNELFNSTNVTVISILGKIIVKSDIPALTVTGTPNKTKVLSLVERGLIVDNTSDIITNLHTANGSERIVTTWQADYSFGLKLKGYKWDGNASPTDADLATGSNWDMVMASTKHTAGTLAIADIDQ